MPADWSLTKRGLSLFPLLPESKRPALEWEPYLAGRRATPAELHAWQAARYNSAVATGGVSGCVVLDCDSLTAWAAAIERGIPDTLTVTTPRGWHFYFQHPGHPVSNRADLGKPPRGQTERVGPRGWDIRGDGGYVVGPDSHYTPDAIDAAKGKVAGWYRIETDAPLAPLPDWLVDLLARPDIPDRPAAPAREADATTPYGYRALHDELATLAAAVDGEVNDQINRTAFAIGQLVAGGEITTDDGWDALAEALAARGLDGEEKALGTLQRGWDAGQLEPRAATAALLDPTAAFGTRATSAGAVSDVPEPPVTGEQPIVPPPPPTSFGPTSHSDTVSGGLITDYFAGCVYLSHEDAMWTPGGVLLKKSPFDGIYGGPQFYLNSTGDAAAKTRSAWETFRTNNVVRLPRAHRTCFRPELPPGAILTIEGLPLLNAYVPVAVRRVPGDPSRFTNHVRKMLPVGDDAELLLHWMASCVQNPGAKFQWWPVIQGAKGNGKTLLLSAMLHAIGSRYSHLVNPEAMQKTGNQFNAWIERKLFLGFEEIRTGDGQHAFVEMMKDTITNRQIAAEGKGVAQATVDNRANGMMLTNWGDAVPVSDDERRYGIFQCAQQSLADLIRDGMGGSYFPSLYNWLRDEDGYGIVAHYLATRPLAAAMDPARDLHRAPDTSSTGAARRASLGNVELEVLEAIEEGQHGFCGGMVTTDALKPIMERARIGRKRWPLVMAALGYHLHPRLLDGRMTHPIASGKRPRLYVLRGGAAGALAGGELSEAFDAAQAGATETSNVVSFGRRGASCNRPLIAIFPARRITTNCTITDRFDGPFLTSVIVADRKDSQTFRRILWNVMILDGKPRKPDKSRFSSRPARVRMMCVRMGGGAYT